MNGRIPCINPTCRRTAAAEKYAEGEEIVCSKCWKLLPKALTARYRQVRRRWRSVDRLVKKRQTRSVPFRFDPYDLLDRQAAANWAEIHSYFTTPPAPAGLENFMKENGLV